jgi:hypothetical protein
MGHADRPWLHNALSLDTEPRRIRLSLARCAHSDANSDGFTDSYGYGYSNTNSYCDTNSHCDTNFYTGPQIYAHTKAAPDAAAASVRRLF